MHFSWSRPFLLPRRHLEKSYRSDHTSVGSLLGRHRFPVCSNLDLTNPIRFDESNIAYSGKSTSVQTGLVLRGTYYHLVANSPIAWTFVGRSSLSGC